MGVVVKVFDGFDFACRNILDESQKYHTICDIRSMNGEPEKRLLE